jgi:hypothetical protein
MVSPKAQQPCFDFWRANCSVLGKTKECTKMPQQNQRSSSDDYSNKDHPKTSAEGKSGGNAGAGKSGKEGLGTEKKTDDERFGSQEPTS